VLTSHAPGTLSRCAMRTVSYTPITRGIMYSSGAGFGRQRPASKGNERDGLSTRRRFTRQLEQQQ